MATEQQLLYNAISGISGQAGGKVRAGQRLTITNRTVSKLSFLLSKINSPTGDITFTIRKGSDGSVIVSKVWADASTLPTYPSQSWKEVTFDVATYVNEEVFISFEFSGGDASNQVVANFQNTDVKASEYWGYYITSWAWETGEDFAYKYTYVVGDSLTVTTQVVTDIVSTTATGNGNVTDLGDSAVTQHGHCWNTTGTPTTADSKTENGAKAATGAFTSSLTGLTSATKYYVRAYATNSTGTSYGATVIFIAGAPGSGELSGVIAIVETRLHILDAYGNERGSEFPLM